MNHKKKQRTTNVKILAILMLVAVISGCATVKQPTESSNPPPAEAFSNFSDFELKPIDRSSSCEKQRGADMALDAIQSKLYTKMRKLIENWKASPTRATNDRKLIIQPVCVEARLVGKGARLGLGLFSGESGVVMNVRYIDSSSGKVVAEPVFYQRTNVFSGAYSWGATDLNMLERLVSLISVYSAKNYESAVGGSTGLEVNNN